VLIGLILLTSSVLLAGLAAAGTTGGRVEPGARFPATVVKVVDGDSIEARMDRRTERVRYIGIDAPEMAHAQRGEEPGARRAREANRRLVGGRAVELELDVQTRDDYGRLLAYVWVGSTMVNAELVAQGYATTLTIPPNVKHAGLFLRLERQARSRGVGLWRATPHRLP
jgi:micrococcal nuclease